MELNKATLADFTKR